MIDGNIDANNEQTNQINFSENYLYTGNARQDSVRPRQFFCHSYDLVSEAFVDTVVSKHRDKATRMDIEGKSLKNKVYEC